MTYDYFNTSNLAFGSKLTKAFQSLTKLADDAYIKSNEVIKRWELYATMLGRNYQVPRPDEADSPVRTSELYTLLSGSILGIQDIYYQNNRLHVIIHKFTKSTNRITRLSGSTTLKAGYVYIQDAISNQQISRQLQFVSDKADGKGNLLFQYRIDKEGVINLIDDISPLLLMPYDISQYTSVNTFETIIDNPIEANYTRFDNVRIPYGTSKKVNYTPKEDECLIAIGSNRGIAVLRDNTVIMQGMGGNQVIRSMILYAQAGRNYRFDNCVKVLRVKYMQNMPETREA